jgi:hypothetical protein
MAEVAIRNIAPIKVERVLEASLVGADAVSGSTLLDDGRSGVCAMAAPGRSGVCTRGGAGKSLRPWRLNPRELFNNPSRGSTNI